MLSDSLVDNGTAWYENTDGRDDFGAAQEISPQVGSMLAAEIDGDGDIDVVVEEP